MNIRIILGTQSIHCSVRPICSRENAFEGQLDEEIEDEEAGRFWSEYEEAVDGIMLLNVDTQEKQLLRLPYYVLVDGQQFHASEVDLQIFPSSRAFSLLLPRSRPSHHSKHGEDGTDT